MPNKHQPLFRVLITIAIAIGLAGCATPRTQRVQVDESANQAEMKLQNELALEGLVNDDIRLQQAAFDIKLKSASMCGEHVKYGLGIYSLSQEMIPKQMRDAAKTLYQIEGRLKVLSVYPGSSGEDAGLLPKDELVSINQWLIPQGEDSVKRIREKTSELLKDGKPMVMKIARGQEEKELTITPKKECEYPVIMHESDELNAFADGKNVFITRGMMRFAQNDTELALVISHEMAHNSMEHMKSKKTNYVLGTILDVLITAGTGANTQGAFGNMAANAYSQEFEAEADYVGMYLMAEAGKDMDSAPKFWRKMAAAHPSGIKANYSSSHPSTAYRLLALEQTVKEIKGKMVAGNQLVPEMKKTAATSTSSSEKSVASNPATESSTLVAAGSISGAFGSKEIQKAGVASLVKAIAVKFTISNLTEKEVARVVGKVKLLDDTGGELGTISFRSENHIPPNDSVEITENAYPVVFPGYGKLKELAQENIKAEFTFDTIEFSDGTKFKK